MAKRAQKSAAPARAYWLVKSEPGTWSWDDQVNAPERTTAWDGVRNHQANNHMKAMSIGDRAFFYHSVKAREIVGIVEIVQPHVPDPSDTTGKGFGMVTVQAVEPMPRPVNLSDIKAAADEHPALADMVLLKQSRLSVQPVTPEQWRIICRMGGLKKA
ncbi:MAG: EVE domain-containing protein [Phycisphaeraceae bacterium]